MYAACLNKSESPVTFTLSVSNQENPTFKLKKPFRGKKQIRQQVMPGSYLTIIARVTNFDYKTNELGKNFNHLIVYAFLI
jgi:hypothetical protein